MLSGAARRNRTPDPIITNDVLYQLSYCGALPAPGTAPAVGVAVYANSLDFGNRSMQARRQTLVARVLETWWHF